MHGAREANRRSMRGQQRNNEDSAQRRKETQTLYVGSTKNTVTNTRKGLSVNTMGSSLSRIAAYQFADKVFSRLYA